MVGLGDDETLLWKAVVPHPKEASVSTIAGAMVVAVSVLEAVIVVIVSCSFRHLYREILCGTQHVFTENGLL